MSKPDAILAAALAEAAWSEADIALANAWRDAVGLCRWLDARAAQVTAEVTAKVTAQVTAASNIERNASRASRGGDRDKEGRNAGDASPWIDASLEAAMVRQSLDVCLRRRGLRPFEVVGEIVAFDPLRHDLEGAVARAGRRVVVRAPGVERSAFSGGAPVLRARVGPVRRVRSAR